MTIKENQKIIVMAVLIAFSCSLTIYFHLVLGISHVFTHFFYIPVILAAFWWKRKGIVVAVFLAGVLITGHMLFSGDVGVDEDYLRGFSFIFVSSVVALLSERVARKEKKVEYNHAELDQIFQTAADGMRVVDKDFNVLRMNETFLKMAGISRDKAAGRKCYEVVPGPRCHTPGCPLTRISGGEAQVTDEIEKERGDGSRVPCIVTATPFRHPDGELIGVVEDFRDITGRKKAEEELKQHRDHLQELVTERTAALTESMMQLQREIIERKHVEEALRASETSMKAILESLQSALIIIDPKTHIIIDINAVAIRMIGAPRDEIIGHVCHKYICPADLGKCPISDLKQTIDLSERILLNAKGERIPILKSVTPTVISGRECFIENVIDITRLKRVEEDLRKSQIQLAEAMDLANLVNWEFDVATGIFTFDNRFYALYGTTAEREGGNQMPAEVYAREFVHPDEINIVADEVQNAITATDPNFIRRFEHRIVRRDGEIRHITVQFGITKDAKGRTIKAQGANQDITERKQAEEKLKRFNEELEQQVGQRTEQINASLQEKVLLLREIHHRVNNNLQILMSLLNLQSRSVPDENVRVALNETRNRIRAMALVHEKLYQTTDLSKIDLSDYTRFLVSQLFTFYGVNSRKVTVNIDIGKIMLDIDTAIPLGLILNELVSNSLKHAFPKEREGDISISVGKQNHALSILFKDNGVGIPEVPDWRNAKPLGLRLVISLVEQLSGTIELDRSAGTKFTIVVQEKE